MSGSRWPRLSADLPAPKHPQQCQRCGTIAPPLERWQECDDVDHQTPVIVVLCRACAAREIKPHPRLYRRLWEHDPHAGSMALCVDCVYRDGTRCAHPKAQANGGPGVMLTIARPMHAMVDGRDYRGPMTLWRQPATACDCRSVGQPRPPLLEQGRLL